MSAGRAAIVAVLLLTASVAGCSSSSAPPTAGRATTTSGAGSTSASSSPAPSSATTVSEPAVAAATWSDCKNGLQCTRVLVPVDYDRPAAGTTTVGLTRLAAAPGPAEGTLFFDSGGPGLSGDEALRALQSFFPAALHQHLDIVAMSRRGTTTSTKLTCGPTPAQVTGSPLSDPGALVARYRRSVPACQRAQRPIGDLSTVTAAHDLDRARRALGLSRIEYLGLSYGTLLGDTYVQLFPSRVRAMVLDGAVDPAESLLADAQDIAPVDERALAAALAGCRAEGAACPLGADPAATYAKVRTRLAASPEPGSPPVTDGDLAAATLMYLTVPAFTAGFFPAVVAAETGDGSKLRAVAVGNYQDIDGTSTIGPYWATTCEDSPTRPSVAQLESVSARLGALDPDTGREAVAYSVAGCLGWPPPTQPIPTARPVRAPPVVVIGGTNDPQTPVAWARHLVAELGPGVGRLVVRGSAGHTAFLNDPGPCITTIEVDDLVDGVAPPALTTCPR